MDYALNLGHNSPEGAADRVYTMLVFLDLDARADMKAALDQASVRADNPTSSLNN